MSLIQSYMLYAARHFKETHLTIHNHSVVTVKKGMSDAVCNAV